MALLNALKEDTKISKEEKGTKEEKNKGKGISFLKIVIGFIWYFFLSRFVHFVFFVCFVSSSEGSLVLSGVRFCVPA